jgi:hypothetical protein
VPLRSSSQGLRRYPPPSAWPPPDFLLVGAMPL